MRGGFHARETLVRFPRSASVCLLTDTRMGVGGGSACPGCEPRFINTVCRMLKSKHWTKSLYINAAIYQKHKTTAHVRLYLLLVLWWCVYRCDGGQVAAPGQQQAEVPAQKPQVRHHHQPHPLQQPVELHMPASSTAQVRDSPETTLYSDAVESGVITCFSWVAL